MHVTNVTKEKKKTIACAFVEAPNHQALKLGCTMQPN